MSLLSANGPPPSPGISRLASRRTTTFSSHSDSSRSARSSKRYSVTAIYSIAAEQDVEVQDELSRAQRKLRELKAKISVQSKKNFVLERDVRYLDSRIALLIQNRMALDEQNEVASHLEGAEELLVGTFPDDRKLNLYSNLFFLLQTEPRHIASLCRLVTLTEIDTLLQTVMFTIYGQQYESREEHLLLTMFQSVLSAQFEATTEFASLLRQNTPVSRMMNTYTRRGPGQAYLRTVLAERINSLIEHKDLNLEINPLKVYEQMLNQIEQESGKLPGHLPRGVSAEVAALNDDTVAIIRPRLTMLMEVANSFLNTIIGSIDAVPYGIRWICKQIRSLTRRKYPEGSELAVCSLIGGFFFLRFINPAIVTPHAYMLVDGVPRDSPRRTLTLVAKMLQNLANKPSYAKEPYMTNLSPFIDSNKARINKFLNDLCEVGDFYESLEIDQYIALSKKDLRLNITLNEVYSTHALLEKHLGVISPDSNSHLRIILNELGHAPAPLPRKENRAIEVELYSRWESPVSELTEALDITSSDLLFMETKSAFVQLIRSLPPSSSALKYPLDLQKVADTAAKLKDAGLVRKGIKALDMLRELAELHVVDKNDRFNPLVDEVDQELAHLGSLREKVIRETRSLDSVYKTICDHNEYLRSQLETYKSYLQNVRSGGVSGGVGLVTVGGKEKKAPKSQLLGPYKFTFQQLEKEGIIVASSIPEQRRSHTFFDLSSPVPGTFIIALKYKGRSKGLLELDLKLDDLLEMQQNNMNKLDLEYVHLDVGVGSVLVDISAIIDLNLTPRIPFTFCDVFFFLMFEVGLVVYSKFGHPAMTGQDPQTLPKIELESLKDLLFLSDNLSRAAHEKLEQNLPSTNEDDPVRQAVDKALQQFLTRTFELALPSIRVNGMNADVVQFREATKESTEVFEPYNPDLIHQVEDLQKEIEDTTLSISQLRRNAPKKIAQIYASSLEPDVAQTLPVDENDPMEEAISVPFIPREESVRSEYIHLMENLQKLTKTIPSAVAHVERAHDVVRTLSGAAKSRIPPHS
ncbi:GTPase-activating protein [Neolecta irregularis DAH-3]|uniref:GTPase-activating protein n=1 Tax=Neolecta irregularis (strain DAH-3) TaxID=1198029 RepID=A0A1U7LNR2_NEOID|nr:GTPase-activating protein [Neolecta irregularis DAH-3]|eukprot:OLL24295.1 GTPase-activating protein [Neolecta irregularis DAH-3]